MVHHVTIKDSHISKSHFVVTSVGIKWEMMNRTEQALCIPLLFLCSSCLLKTHHKGEEKKRLHLPAQKPNSRGSDPLALLGHAFCVHCIKSISSNHYVDLLFGFSLGPKLYFSSGNWCILIFYWNILLFFFFIQVTNSIFFYWTTQQNHVARGWTTIAYRSVGCKNS